MSNPPSSSKPAAGVHSLSPQCTQRPTCVRALNSMCPSACCCNPSMRLHLCACMRVCVSVQALGIATKINKGTIELVSDVHLIKAGDKVGASQATLLGKLGIKPFKYGLVMMKVFENGALYDSAILDISDDDMLAAVGAAISNIAALCLATGFPTLASIPHSVINGYKNVLAISLATDFTFPQAQKVGSCSQSTHHRACQQRRMACLWPLYNLSALACCP